jgi:maleate isomerase
MRHFGVLIPSTNTTVEIEYTQLLPASLQAHYARVGKAQKIPFSPSLDTDLAYQSRMLGDAKVEVIALTQTSASMFDDDYDATATASMQENSGAPALTSAQAIGEAVNALGMRRIALVSPYSEAVMARTKNYYESRYNLDVITTVAFGASDSYAIGALSAGNATDAFASIQDSSIEVLVVPGGNFPTMKHIAEWENRFGKVVLTTNQVVIWAVMNAMGIREPLAGLGRLLAEQPRG